jgi:hypothetical protein
MSRLPRTMKEGINLLAACYPSHFLRAAPTIPSKPELKSSRLDGSGAGAPTPPPPPEPVVDIVQVPG